MATFDFHVLWKPTARQNFIDEHGGDKNNLRLPEDLCWKVLPSLLRLTEPFDESNVKEFADKLALDQSCNVHVFSSLTPGDLWYHSYADGRKGTGWPD